MRQAIDTAPRDGKTVILEDDASGTYDVAHWSAKAGGWVGENGEPSKITPTHWYLRPRDQYSLQEDDRSPRRFAALSISATLMTVGLMAVGLTGLYFRVVGPETHLSSQDSHKTDLLTLQQLAEADRARVKAGALVRPAAEAPLREARQSLTTGQGTEVLANELAEDRRAIDGLDRRLQSEAANSAQLLGQNRQNGTAAWQELTATVQYRQALDEERARSAALASELATAQREMEAQAAQLRMASDETAQLKQAEAAESAQSLEQERQRIAVLAQEAAAARQKLTASTEQHRLALDEERLRRAALWSELATAQHEIEVQAAQLRQAREETGQLKQTTESATAELQRSLQQERDRTTAMARDLDSTRRFVGARITSDPAASNPTSKAAPAAEVAAMTPPAATELQGSAEATRLIARARTLLGQGDIGAARTVLERAAETGSARAIFMLAETYDPGILSAWGTYGTRGEVTKARELYAKAHAGGIQEAKNRFNALRQ